MVKLLNKLKVRVLFRFVSFYGKNCCIEKFMMELIKFIKEMVIVWM